MRFNFGRKKIQKTKYTHWVTLPPEWVTNMGIRKGDEVTIELCDDLSLRIAPATLCKNVASDAKIPIIIEGLS